MSESARSPQADLEGTEMRREQRLVLLLRPAKVICRSGEYLCILRDVASGGARLRLFHPLPPEPHMVLELGNGDRYDIEKVWEREDQAGFVFAQAASLDHLLEERSRFRKRGVRVSLSLDAVVTVAGKSYPATVTNISQQGGSIECEARFAKDQRIAISAAGLPARDAKVRWQRGSSVGLVFEQTFKLDQLARLLHQLQPFGPAIPEEDHIFRRAQQG